MAVINYSSSYTSSTPRSFDSTYLGNHSRTLKQFYLGGYIKAYEGNYSQEFIGYYADQYQKAWSAAYIGQYEGQFIGYYTKAYEGSYEGLFQNQFTGYYTGTYVGQYTKTYAGIYAGVYTHIWTQAWAGIYTHAWTNNTGWQRQWTGSYTGYFGDTWAGAYAHIWSGHRTYTAQYTGYYSHVWVGQYTHAWERNRVVNYTATWSGWYNGSTWTGIYNSYSQGQEYYTGNYTGTYVGAYAGNYTGQYARNFVHNPTWEHVIAPNWTGSYTAYTPATTGQYQGTQTQAYASFTVYGDNFYVGAINWSGGIPGGPVNYAKAYAGPSYEGVVYLGYDPELGPLGSTPVQFATSYIKLYSQSWTGVYGGSVTIQQWTGTQTFAGLVNKAYTGYYTGYYDQTWTRIREATVGYIGYWTGSYVASFQGYYEGTAYSKTYLGYYTGTYEGAFTGNYEGQFGGERYHPEQFTGYYTGNYVHGPWSGIYTGAYTGLATYGSNVNGLGSFSKAYTGYYTGQYEKAYTGYYTGYFDRQYSGSYTHAWDGQYTGQRAHSWTRVRTVNYAHAWSHQFEGSFGNTFGATYSKIWEGNWTGTFTGYYNKLYGGAYLGDTAKSYSGASGNYTSTSTANVSFDRVYSGSTNYLSTKSGELATSGVARIKDGGAWKQAKAVHVKKDGAWKESKAIYVRKDNDWVLSHIGYERTDITINSNTHLFVLESALSNLGKSVSSRPQMVNIIIEGCDVYSTTGHAALDLATSLGAINLHNESIKHQVRVLVHPDARIIGTSGAPGTQNSVTRTGGDATDGGMAIKTSPAINLYIENYGIIAGGGGGGGSGGWPVSGSFASAVGGLGGYGAGYANIGGTTTNILENNSLINGTNAAISYGIHGGRGGLLGQRGAAAGGFVHDDSSLSVANDGALKTQYDLSGNGGLPGAAIKGYDASRTTFINTGNVWGDSKYKLQA